MQRQKFHSRKHRSEQNSNGSQHSSVQNSNGRQHSSTQNSNSRQHNSEHRSHRGRRNFSKGRRNTRTRRLQGTKIDPAKYVAKAEAGESVSVYVPSSKFSDFKLAKILQKNVLRKSYVSPTKIQDQAIPYIIEERDLLGLASTGSGKTAAFLLPMINKMIRDRTQKCLIVTPTRELAEQIRAELLQFSEGTNIRSVLIIGGKSIRNQIHALKKQPQFIIGTPGRLIDLYNRRVLRLEEFNNVILDEVDRMLDMGFIKDIEFLILKLKKDKQSLFFSATMTDKAEKIAANFLRNPVKIQIEKQSPLKNIEQSIVRVNSQNKLGLLQDLLNKVEFEKVLIFSRTRYGADRMAKKLKNRGFQIDSIHGDKSQARRARSIDAFKSGKIKILVATDVASRGLDIDDITHVINYDEPSTFNTYIHRIGRTGRVGKPGNAITFVM